MTNVAEILSLPNAEKVGPVQLAQFIADGLPTRSADGLRVRLQRVGPRAFDGIVPEATLRRARKARKALSKDASERLYDMARVLAEAENLFEDEDKAIRFMTRPNPFLDMKTPFEMARSSTAGADAVLVLIGQVRAGVAA